METRALKLCRDFLTALLPDLQVIDGSCFFCGRSDFPKKHYVYFRRSSNGRALRQIRRAELTLEKLTKWRFQSKEFNRCTRCKQSLNLTLQMTGYGASQDELDLISAQWIAKKLLQLAGVKK